MGSGNHHDTIVFNFCRIEGQSESRLVNVITLVGVHRAFIELYLQWEYH